MFPSYRHCMTNPNLITDSVPVSCPATCPRCEHCRRASVPRCGEQCWKKRSNGSPGWPTSPCTAACLPEEISPTSSSRRRNASTGATRATWPSWRSVSMETSITFGYAPWRGDSQGSLWGWCFGNSCWTRASLLLWPPVFFIPVGSAAALWPEVI